MHKSAAIAAIAGITTAAAAQPHTTGSTVSYALDFTDIGGNSNGTLESGESALIRLSLAFTGQNTTASWTPPIVQGSGTIRGYGAGFLDVRGTSPSGGSTTGVWNLDFVNPGHGPISVGWDLYPTSPEGWGWVGEGGARIHNIEFGQLPMTVAAINPANPISPIWQALWTPTSYAARTVRFDVVEPNMAADTEMAIVLFQTVSNNPFWAVCPFSSQTLSIPIVPAPASSLVLAATLFIARRRSLP